MNKELMGALDELEHEKISARALLDAIEQSTVRHTRIILEKLTMYMYH